MKNPRFWENPETRSTYTQQREAEAQSIARGDVVAISTTDALETAAGFYGAAFAAAKVKGSNRARSVLGPDVLCLMARELIDPGESVWFIRVVRGRLRLIRSSYFQVYGEYDPETWRYRLNLPAPTSGLKTLWADETDVIHLKYSSEKQRPWRGVGPVQKATTSGKLLAALEQMLGNEAAATSGYLLAFPSGSLGGTEGEKKKSALGSILQGLKNSKGGTAGIQLGAEPMDLEATKTAKPGIQSVRVGMDVPEAVAELREPVRLSVLSACGIPPGFTSAQSATNMRESYRVWVFSRILPLAKIVQAELSRKLNEEIELNFEDLAAADTQGRSRAFKSLVDGGMNEEIAARICGFSGEN